MISLPEQFKATHLYGNFEPLFNVIMGRASVAVISSIVKND